MKKQCLCYRPADETTPFIENWKLFLMDRDVVDDPANPDPTIQQLIPYVTIYRNYTIERAGQPVQSLQVLSYQRGAETTEQRLTALRSVGFGGHIDSMPADLLIAHIFNEISRELTEELGFKINTRELEKSILGSIRSNNLLVVRDGEMVDRVHTALGIMIDFEKHPGNDDLVLEEGHIEDVRWVGVEEVTPDELGGYESWSKLVITGLTRMIGEYRAAKLEAKQLEEQQVERAKIAAQIGEFNKAAEAHPDGAFIIAQSPLSAHPAVVRDYESSVLKVQKNEEDGSIAVSLVDDELPEETTSVSITSGRNWAVYIFRKCLIESNEPDTGSYRLVMTGIQSGTLIEEELAAYNADDFKESYDDQQDRINELTIAALGTGGDGKYRICGEYAIVSEDAKKIINVERDESVVGGFIVSLADTEEAKLKSSATVTITGKDNQWITYRFITMPQGTDPNEDPRRLVLVGIKTGTESMEGDAPVANDESQNLAMTAAMRMQAEIDEFNRLAQASSTGAFTFDSGPIDTYPAAVVSSADSKILHIEHDKKTDVFLVTLADTKEAKEAGSAKITIGRDDVWSIYQFNIIPQMADAAYDPHRLVLVSILKGIDPMEGADVIEDGAEQSPEYMASEEKKAAIAYLNLAAQTRPDGAYDIKQPTPCNADDVSAEYDNTVLDVQHGDEPGSFLVSLADPTEVKEDQNTILTIKNGNNWTEYLFRRFLIVRSAEAAEPAEYGLMLLNMFGISPTPTAA